MELTLLKCKIHGATVTEANLNYVGSITVDGDLMDKCGLLEYERVQVVNSNNGARIETYTFRGAPGSGILCLNGAAARHFQPGDRVIIMAYAQLTPQEAKVHRPVVLIAGKKNTVEQLGYYERSGTIV